MGEVYRARDVRLGREVALKVLPESGANDADSLARFEREARALPALNHPNIVSIHDTDEHRWLPYAVTELLDGHNLSCRLRSAPVPPKPMIETMTSVLKDDPAKFPETEKIPPEIRPFIFRSLEKDPADRYQAARDLLLDLRAFQAEQTHEAAERVQFRAEPPWKHRRTRVLLRATAGVLLFLLGIFVGSCWQRGRMAGSPAASSSAPAGSRP